MDLPKLCAALLFSVLVAVAQPAIGTDYPAPQEGDFQIQDFEFASGEVIPELNLHYTHRTAKAGCFGLGLQRGPDHAWDHGARWRLPL